MTLPELGKEKDFLFSQQGMNESESKKKGNNINYNNLQLLFKNNRTHAQFNYIYTKYEQAF